MRNWKEIVDAVDVACFSWCIICVDMRIKCDFGRRRRRNKNLFIRIKTFWNIKLLSLSKCERCILQIKKLNIKYNYYRCCVVRFFSLHFFFFAFWVHYKRFFYSRPAAPIIKKPISFIVTMCMMGIFIRNQKGVHCERNYRKQLNGK